MTNTTSRTLTRSLFGASAALVLFASIAGCGGRQRPAETGSCHPWREWVAPRQVDGQWQDGYCRDR